MMNFTKEQGAEIIVFTFLKKETRKYKSYQSCNANPNNIIEMNRFWARIISVLSITKCIYFQDEEN